MPVSTVLTCVPEETGVHSERKLSILSLFSRSGIFPRWPSLLGLPFIFGCEELREGLGKAPQMCPPPGLQTGLDPSMPRGDGTHPGVRG